MLIVAFCQSNSCHLLDSPKQLLLLPQFAVCLTDGNCRASPLLPPPSLFSFPELMSLHGRRIQPLLLRTRQYLCWWPQGLDKGSWNRAEQIVSVNLQESSTFHISWRWGEEGSVSFILLFKLSKLSQDWQKRNPDPSSGWWWLFF